VLLSGHAPHPLHPSSDYYHHHPDGGLTLESTLDYVEAGDKVNVTRRATYVFRREADGHWVCTVDNSYGTALLDYPPR
jgi:ketosteroid isomerase-like protein